MSKNLRRRRALPRRTAEARLDTGAPPEAALRAALDSDPKTLMLCAQAQRALEFALGTACGDEALTGLAVIAVMPDPTARRLRVWLRGPADLDPPRRAHVLGRLAEARGFLRTQVAHAIHRKRTPELAFELLVDAGATEGAPALEAGPGHDTLACGEKRGDS